MKIVRPEAAALAAAALVFVSVSGASAQTVNPLAGDTKQAQASAFGPVAAPQASRGKLEADPASGGQVFTDEAGWYRFTMADGGTTQMQDGLRMFQFKSGGQNALCLAVRKVNTAFSQFGMGQIQAEIETLYAPLILR